MAKKKKSEDEKNPDHVEKQAFTRQLRVDLTTKEVADRADRAAHMVADIAIKDQQLKEHTKHAKSTIGQLVAEHAQISNEIRDRATYKDVSCDRIYNYTAGTVSEVRTDTGEVLETRAMTPAEAQRSMPFDDGGGSDVDEDFADEPGEAAE